MGRCDIWESGWRIDRDSNPGDGHPPTRFPSVRLRPLGHRSVRAVYETPVKFSRAQTEVYPTTVDR